MFKKTIFAAFLLILSGRVVSAITLNKDVSTKIVVMFIDVTTRQPKTGITVTSETCRRTKADMTTTSFSPTASGGLHDQVELGNGQYSQELDGAGDLDVEGPFYFNCYISGSEYVMFPYEVLSIGTDSDFVATMDAESTQLAGIRAKTDFLPAVTAGASGGVFIAGSNAATTVNITGTLSNVTTVANLTNLPTIPNNWLTSAGISDNAFIASKFADDASTEFANKFLATTYEGSETIKDWYRGARASLWGLYTKSGNVYSFKSLNGLKTRLAITSTSTPPARSAVTTDYTD